MTFVSLSFVTFFAVVLLGLRLAPGRRARQWLLLLASVWFYASWRPVYLLVLAAPILVDYGCGIRIEESAEITARKRWLAVAVSSNLLLLAYFKYANFFLQNLTFLAGPVPRHLDIALPRHLLFHV
jgi:alginate O-acetyltransferase complex protein AlgI